MTVAGSLVRGLGIIAALLVALAGCAEPCCTFDGRPTTLQAGSDGALFLAVAPVRRSGAAAGPTGFALVDTATPVTFWQAGAPRNRVGPRDFTVFDATAPYPARAFFSGIGAVETTLTQASAPGPVHAVLSGEFLHRFVLAFDGSVPSLALWSSQPAGSSFLSESGYSVLKLETYGGGQLDARGEPDAIGQRGPHQFPATRLVLRACAAPDPFAVTDALPATCCAGEERAHSSGVDLALVVGTGFGPLVLSESAFARVATIPGTAPPGEAIPLHHPLFAQPVIARRARLDRLALVDRETSSRDDQGPCVELGHARRLELVAISQARNSQTAACALPCDQDPRARPKALNGAAYVEFDGTIEVAVVPDEAPILQGLRAEIRPEGPEIDGILGAAALKSTRFEIDYLSVPSRLIVSCPGSSASPGCRAVGRCPRLPSPDDSRLCYGLTAHRLPQVCENSTNACR